MPLHDDEIRAIARMAEHDRAELRRARIARAVFVIALMAITVTLATAPMWRNR